MGIVSEVKCGRCDRRYSGFHTRCPYCGARRNIRGKHAGDSESAKGRIIIGILLMLVLAAAVIVLIITSTPGNKNSGGGSGKQVASVTNTASTNSGSQTTTPATPTASDSGIASPSGTSNSASGNSPSDTGSQSGSGTAVKSVTLQYLGENKTDVTLKVGDTLPMKCVITPDGAGGTPAWSSDNEKVFTVSQTGSVVGVGSGTATLTVTAGGVSATCTVRVHSAS